VTRNLVTYRGYTARLEFDADDQLFYGDVIDLADTITFSGSSVDELIGRFHEAVDTYLAFCSKMNRDPEKPYSGRVQLRISKQLHRSAAIEAAEQDVSLNDLFVLAISSHLDALKRRRHAQLHPVRYGDARFTLFAQGASMITGATASSPVEVRTVTLPVKSRDERGDDWREDTTDVDWQRIITPGAMRLYG
jgi:predicted HicB family RNase H-like nuclease